MPEMIFLNIDNDNSNINIDNITTADDNINKEFTLPEVPEKL